MTTSPDLFWRLAELAKLVDARMDREYPTERPRLVREAIEVLRTWERSPSAAALGYAVALLANAAHGHPGLDRTITQLEDYASAGSMDDITERANEALYAYHANHGDTMPSPSSAMSDGGHGHIIPHVGFHSDRAYVAHRTVQVGTIRVLSGRLHSPKHPGDAGFDLEASVDLEGRAGDIVSIPTGVRLDLAGWSATIRPRSGLTRMGCLVQLGTIDAGYTGELIATAVMVRDARITRGQRIAQLVFEAIAPVAVGGCVGTTSELQRGSAGWGSTDGSPENGHHG